uniref:Uncharacterized protein n=1 Tax=Strongyloides papillosus TaxID=174720 RepID=A0A0N5C368_STREA
MPSKDCCCRSLLALIISSSTGKCWSSDTFNPVPGVIDGLLAIDYATLVDSKNNIKNKFKKRPETESDVDTDRSLDVTTSETDYSVASTNNPNDSFGDSDHSTGNSSTDSLTGSEWDTSTVCSNYSRHERKEKAKLKNKKRRNLAGEAINLDNQYEILPENPTYFFLFLYVYLKQKN